MLLGLISLMLGQWAGWISQICVNSSLFSSRFYLCSEEDYGKNENFLLTKTFSSLNESDIPPGVNYPSSHQCGEGHEPFVSYEGLEQLHRFLFVLGVTHVLYSCVVVGLAMSKIYSWRKWENEASLALDANLQDASFEAMWQHLPQFVFRVTCTSGIMTKQNMHQYSNTARVLRGKMDLPPLPFEFSPSPPSKLFSRSRRKLKTNMEEETSEHS